jgi:hypothetical protein
MRWRGPEAIVNYKPILSVRAMTARVRLKKKSDREPQEARRQDELIGGKPPIVKYLSDSDSDSDSGVELSAVQLKVSL